jgi:hypothetical protein
MGKSNEIEFNSDRLRTLDPKARTVYIISEIDKKFDKNFLYYAMWCPYEQDGEMAYKLSLSFSKNDYQLKDECIWLRVHPFEGLYDDKGNERSNISKDEICSWAYELIKNINGIA